MQYADVHKMWIANFACQKQFYCNLAAILKNRRLPCGYALKMFLYELNNIFAKFGACIIKCTILPNFGVKKLHYIDYCDLRSSLCVYRIIKVTFNNTFLMQSTWVKIHYLPYGD